MAGSGGRKVYRNRSHAKKQRAKKIASFFVAIIGIAVLVFVGYSVAKPIFNFINSEDSIVDDSSEPWTPPVSEDVESENSGETSVATETTYESESDTTMSISVNSEYFTAYSLPEDSLDNPVTLNQYLSQAKSDGYNAVMITMKAEGGKIYYKTSSEFAATDESAVLGMMPVQQIISLIKASDLKAIASINLLEDNNRYGENRDGSYHNADGTTWLDNAASNGGKPWLSPFDEDTKEYIRYIADEIATAGFDVIAAEGATFPNFRNSDLDYIGDEVRSETRYTALLDVVNIAKSASENQNSDFMLKISAADILNGDAEVFKPQQLGDMTLIIDYSPAEIANTVIYNNTEVVISDLSAAEKVKTVFNIISEEAGENIVIIPMISHSEINQADYNEVIEELISEGYNSYIVK